MFMIDSKHIEELTPQLKSILQNELESGNIICETYQGPFSKDSSQQLMIFLRYPFKSPIRRDILGIVYREINDPHYWKAEYADVANHQTLACHF